MVRLFLTLLRSGHPSPLLGGAGPSHAEMHLWEELFLLWPEVTSLSSEKRPAPFDLFFNLSF